MGMQLLHEGEARQGSLGQLVRLHSDRDAVLATGSGGGAFPLQAVPVQAAS